MRVLTLVSLLALAACQGSPSPSAPAPSPAVAPAAAPNAAPPAPPVPSGVEGSKAEGAAPAGPDYPVLDKLPDDLPPNATVADKYSGLVRVVPAADENVAQGGFRDHGRLDASPTPKVTDLTGVYWVYAAPNWYVWKKATPAALEAVPGADASGKYKNLLKKFAAVDDVTEYGGYSDAGYRNVNEYKGIRDIPPGYWLYYSPFWYVWGQAQPLPLEAPEQARVDGTYDRLLRIIPAPDDAARHGAFVDAGRLTRSAYKGLADLPPGYWVYVQPNWYLWGVNTKLQTEPAE